MQTAFSRTASATGACRERAPPPRAPLLTSLFRPTQDPRRRLARGRHGHRPARAGPAGHVEGRGGAGARGRRRQLHGARGSCGSCVRGGLFPHGRADLPDAVRGRLRAEPRLRHGPGRGAGLHRARRADLRRRQRHNERRGRQRVRPPCARRRARRPRRHLGQPASHGRPGLRLDADDGGDGAGGELDGREGRQPRETTTRAPSPTSPQKSCPRLPLRGEAPEFTHTAQYDATHSS